MKAISNIYNAYFFAKKESLYYNEIKEISNLSDSSLSRALKELTTSKILNKDERKSNTYYKILNKKIFILEFSKLADKKFQNLNTGVKVPLKNFIKEVPNTVFTIILFGSASIKKEKEGSDIDILIVQNERKNYNKLKNKTNISSNYPISIFTCSIDEFVNTKDNVVIQAKKTGFPIYKEQNFYEVTINEYR